MQRLCESHGTGANVKHLIIIIILATFSVIQLQLSIYRANTCVFLIVIRETAGKLLFNQSFASLVLVGERRFEKNYFSETQTEARSHPFSEIDA